MGHLELKGQPFQVFQPAPDTDIQDFWAILKNIEEALQVKHFTFWIVLVEWYSHHCDQLVRQLNTSFIIW